MLISHTDLAEDVVFSIAKEWVVAQMSDTEVQPEVVEWTKKTVAKIKRGELLIEFGEESQTVYIKTKEELSQMIQEVKTSE